jgi:hypothetical protein
VVDVPRTESQVPFFKSYLVYIVILTRKSVIHRTKNEYFWLYVISTMFRKLALLPSSGDGYYASIKPFFF